jgi:hypothetical protein
MINRNIKLLGWGSGTAKITAVLEGVTVFSDSVDLVPATDDNDGEQTAPTLFAFDVPLDFVGTKHMAVSVEGSAVEFGQIVANYSELEMGAIVFSTGPDDYVDVAVDDDNGVKDPRINVTIDGVIQTADRSLGLGTWHYVVNPGSTLEHDLVISVPGAED